MKEDLLRKAKDELKNKLPSSYTEIFFTVLF